MKIKEQKRRRISHIKDTLFVPKVVGTLMKVQTTEQGFNHIPHWLLRTSRNEFEKLTKIIK